MNYCLIPAKGKSTRLPGKNLIDFLGKPIINYPYEQAVKSNLFDRIDVFTNDEKITYYTLHNLTQAKVIQEEPNDSHTRTMSDIVLDYIKASKLTYGKIGLVYPTSVFITADDMIEMSRLSINTTVVACKSIRKHYLNCYIKGTRFSKKYQNKVSQLISTPYVDVGQFYWIDIEAFLKAPVILGDKIKVYKLQTKSIDIDTQEDLDIAKLMYSV